MKTADINERATTSRTALVTLSAMTPLFYALWPAPIIRALDAEGVRTWDDLAQLSPPTLLTHKGIGARGLAFIERALETRQRSLSGAYQPAKLPDRRAAPALAGVYFFRCEGFVKIGHAGNIKRRLRDLETMVPFPLDLWHYIPCASRSDALGLEGALHARFQSLRARGEWFRYAGELVAFLADARG